MRREVLQAAVRRVLSDIDVTGLGDLVQRGFSLARGGPSENTRSEWLDLATLTRYITAVQNYGPAEDQVLDILELGNLSDLTKWQSQLRDIDPEFFFDSIQRIDRARAILPKVLALLDREYVSSERHAAFGADDVAVQTVILTDEGDSLSSPTRLVELLVAVQSIYGVIGEVEGMPETSLAIVGMDSGSEKSFDFLGIAKLVHELRETLQVVYNMITFHRQNVTLKNLQVAGETMSLVSKISKMEKSEAISSDEASRLKQKLFSGLEKFSAAGAYIPEMSAAREQPALAMRPQPRMLTGPVSSIIRESSEDSDAGKPIDHQGVAATVDTAVQEFSADELASAARLLRAASAVPTAVAAHTPVDPPKRVRKRTAPKSVT